MSSNLPNKASSRAGRFKKKLVSEEVLLREAPQLSAIMDPLVDRFSCGSLSAPTLCSLYLLAGLSYRDPKNWLGSLRKIPLLHHDSLSFPIRDLPFALAPNVHKRIENFTTIGELFSYFAFKSTPESVNRTVLNWSQGSYELELMFRIPTPAEVLAQQKHGRRCVSVLWEERFSKKYILGERDSLGFTMHDLIHADHFFHDNQCFSGQLGFYGFLDFCLNKDHFSFHLQDEKFKNEFEYLISDMNAYAIHLMKCFKSALIHYHADGNAFFQNWIGKVTKNEDEIRALELLNSEHFSAEQDQILLNFLSTFTAESSLPHQKF
jgi:hypothetical protein